MTSRCDYSDEDECEDQNDFYLDPMDEEYEEFDRFARMKGIMIMEGPGGVGYQSVIFIEKEGMNRIHVMIVWGEKYPARYIVSLTSFTDLIPLYQITCRNWQEMCDEVSSELLKMRGNSTKNARKIV